MYNFILNILLNKIHHLKVHNECQSAPWPAFGTWWAGLVGQLCSSDLTPGKRKHLHAYLPTFRIIKQINESSTVPASFHLSMSESSMNLTRKTAHHCRCVSRSWPSCHGVETKRALRVRSTFMCLASYAFVWEGGVFGILHC